MTENGGITYRNEDINEPEQLDAKDKVYEVVRTTAEYMRQMETVPFLKADGLEDGYKVLADDENLDEFYDYEGYALQRMNEEDGLFTDRGYIAYKGYTSLAEIMDGSQSSHMEMGGMA